jgi:hypothetical protein
MLLACLLPPTWRFSPLYLSPPGARWPSCTPRHQVPMLVTFLDLPMATLELFISLVTTQGNLPLNFVQIIPAHICHTQVLKLWHIFFYFRIYTMVLYYIPVTGHEY